MFLALCVFSYTCVLIKDKFVISNDIIQFSVYVLCMYIHVHAARSGVMLISEYDTYAHMFG